MAEVVRMIFATPFLTEMAGSRHPMKCGAEQGEASPPVFSRQETGKVTGKVIRCGNGVFF